MDNVRIGVIGLGHLGSLHAKVYKEIPACSLVGICDINQGRATEVSANLGVASFTDYRKLFGKVDAVSITVPTKSHFEVASECLKQKTHVLVEKPFT
ncbi:MAG: Gfo/Idh/MocA family oxidoreductase, partial [Candidatus Omnitrophica bacterium]|nr:Gfo/Idh/MocA family oxidoreductase [Candidatus Omnitrophota bacterium]